MTWRRWRTFSTLARFLLCYSVTLCHVIHTKGVNQEERDSCQPPVPQMLMSLTFCNIKTRHCECFLRARVLEGFLSLSIMENNMACWLVLHESDQRSCSVGPDNIWQQSIKSELRELANEVFPDLWGGEEGTEGRKEGKYSCFNIECLFLGNKSQFYAEERIPFKWNDTSKSRQVTSKCLDLLPLKCNDTWELKCD